jgi:hypothetical protein
MLNLAGQKDNHFWEKSNWGRKREKNASDFVCNAQRQRMHFGELIWF